MTNKYHPLTTNIYLHLALCALVLIVLVLYTANNTPGDFGNYYYGSKFLAQGKFNADVYEPYKFNLAVYNEGLRNFFLNYTPVPPITAILYLPFTVFSFTTAKLVWNILNALLWLWVMYRVHSVFKIPAIHILIITIVLSVPLKSNFQQGQMYILLTALLVEGLIASEAKRNILAGVFFALAILLKIFPAILFGWLLFNRNWKTTILTVVSLVSIVFLSMVVIQPGVWQHYLVNILPRLAAGEINNTYTTTYQSFSVLAKNLLVYDKLHNPSASFNSPDLFRPLDLAFKLGVLLCLAGLNRSGISSLAKFGLWLFGGMLISGYGSRYGLVEMAIILLIIKELRNKWVILVALLLLWLAAVIPLNLFESLPLVLQFPRLYCLFVIFLVFMVYLRPAVKPWWVAGSIGLVAMLWFNLKVDYPYSRYEEYLLEKEQHLLIYDFRISGNQLTYNYFDVKGPGEESIKLPFTAENLEEIDMNKVDYLTPSSESGRGVAAGENTPKAVIIDRKRVIYLSDANRGVGFYTLKMMGFKYMAIH